MNEEDHYLRFKKAVMKSRVISMPKNNISTFGNTIYNYYYVGQVSENQTQIREGHIKIHRPLFLTPFSDKEVIKGFSQEHKEMMKKLLGDLQSNNGFLVEYQFEHLPRHDWVDKTPYPIVLGEMKSNYGDNLFDVLVTGEPQFWPMALIKFCLKIIEKSFPVNLNELEERGFLDQNRIPPQVKKKVEELFKDAEKNASRIHSLGDFLVANKIFEFYEERFFKLMEKTKKNV